MSQIQNLEEAESQIKSLSKQVDVLERRLALYEAPGSTKLYYSLNRKMNEMADILNENNLKNVALNDPKDKTFDRLKIIWNDCTSLATAVKQLGDVAGVSGDEEGDMNKKVLPKITSPESIANVLGNSTGKND